MSLIWIFKFQLIEYGVQGVDPPSKNPTISNNVVAILNNSNNASPSFKSIAMPNAGSTNASPVTKLGTPTRVSFQLLLPIPCGCPFISYIR